MKKILILSMAAFLIFGFTSMAKAALTPALAQFYVIDGPASPDGKVIIDTSLTGINVSGYDYLWYQLNGSGWNFIGHIGVSSYIEGYGYIPVTSSIYSTTIMLPDTNTNYGLISFKITDSDQIGGITLSYTVTTRTFSGLDGVGLYHGVSLLFAGLPYDMSFTTAVGTDHVASSPVPLPGAIWFLGAGLIGLVGVRRRVKD
ncbi:MAG: VPLPA-CTERM sorting domain-containing protein [Desulfobacterium sp.]|nr:VPLPA-CTERM sorting domain-containing protein [Desulfobacterium sp.]MBU3947750.1 VPLPA-CTERM sorting domain-containing protein [Pseudomonadota bacterium]MBU4010705.1 VPLPA-CTERM sorting domain-containing protein [Pseudomonadota bacterium]